MSAPPFGGFPGMPAAAVPGQPQQQVSGFVLIIPPDPDWQPIDQNDTLEKDGYYAARIKGEKPRGGDGQTAGVWLTLELGDPDVVGKTLSKFMTDPRVTKKDTWWAWRSLLRSVTGNTQGGQAGMTYQAGALAGQICYIRTGAYIDDGGTLRTGVDAFITKPEWEDAVRSNKHRWEAKPKASSAGAGPTGVLPGGSGGVFPGLGSGGLPGLPASLSNPMTHPSAPQPSAAAPLSAPPAAPPAAAAAPAPAFGFPPAPPVAPAAQQQPAQFGGFGASPPVTPAATPPSAPQPNGSAFPPFPGT